MKSLLNEVGNMENKKAVMKAYEEILKRELVPAMGCTEPIALAYCAQRQEHFWACCRNVLLSLQAAILLKM